MNTKLKNRYTQISDTWHQPINAYLLMITVAIFLTVTANLTFFDQVKNVYPLLNNFGFVFSLALFLLSLHLFLILLLGYKFTLKFILIFFIMVSSVAGYFTDIYGTVYDTNMLQNALQTDTAEATDLINIKFITRILFLGVIPSFFIARLKIIFPPFLQSTLTRVAILIGTFALIGIMVVTFSGHYASFFREHKPLRYYTNPITPIYSAVNLTITEYKKLTAPTDTIFHANDAKQNTQPATRKPKLVVFIVGEAVRSANSSLEEYKRETFPQVKKLMESKEKITYFSNMESCGTSTAFSVPCMFSYLDERDYNVDEARYHENVIDTLYNIGVNIRWRDNNSSSKGVMDRLPTEFYSEYKSGSNKNCKNHKGNAYKECRDIAMLENLDIELIDKKDNLIVIHQMGNHGPAYYKRYDKAFNKFGNECKSNELATCDSQSIINAYDNAMLMTDDLIAKTISWLKTKEHAYEVAMLYASDHGESLGEKGIYLHGMPKAFAPKEQYEIPAMVWIGKDSQKMTLNATSKLNHDAITPSLLYLFDVETNAVKDNGFFIKK